MERIGPKIQIIPDRPKIGYIWRTVKVISGIVFAIVGGLVITSLEWVDSLGEEENES